MRRRLVVLAFLAAAVPAGAQTPGGEIVETKDGIVFKKATPVPRPTPDRSLFRPTDAPGAPMVVPPPSKGPTGPAVVDASYFTVRGTLVKIEKGKAITVVDARTGRERRVLLTESTLVVEGLKAGDAVAVRVPFGLVAVRGTRFFAGPSNGVFGVFVVRGLVMVVGVNTAMMVASGFGSDLTHAGAEPTVPHAWGAARIASAMASVN